jgi:hypothetical protein
MALKRREPDTDYPFPSPGGATRLRTGADFDIPLSAIKKEADMDAAQSLYDLKKTARQAHREGSLADAAAADRIDTPSSPADASERERPRTALESLPVPSKAMPPIDQGATAATTYATAISTQSAPVSNYPRSISQGGILPPQPSTTRVAQTPEEQALANFQQFQHCFDVFSHGFQQHFGEALSGLKAYLLAHSHQIHNVDRQQIQHLQWELQQARECLRRNNGRRGESDGSQLYIAELLRKIVDLRRQNAALDAENGKVKGECSVITREKEKLLERVDVMADKFEALKERVRVKSKEVLGYKKRVQLLAVVVEASKQWARELEENYEAMAQPTPQASSVIDVSDSDVSKSDASTSDSSKSDSSQSDSSKPDLPKPSLFKRDSTE